MLVARVAVFWYVSSVAGQCHLRGLQSQERRRQWHPTPVLLPRKSHRQRSLVGCSPWGRQNRTRLSDFTFTFHFHALEKEMAIHSSVLAWRIPGTGSLVGCRLWGRTESDTTEATQQQQQQSQEQTRQDGAGAIVVSLLCFTQRPCRP